jgi:hypothetical protein
MITLYILFLVPEKVKYDQDDIEDEDEDEEVTIIPS